MDAGVKPKFRILYRGWVVLKAMNANAKRLLKGRTFKMLEHNDSEYDYYSSAWQGGQSTHKPSNKFYSTQQEYHGRL